MNRSDLSQTCGALASYATFCKLTEIYQLLFGVKLILCFFFDFVFIFRLSGLSPFMGDSDVDTFANITRADYDFDDEAFDAVTQNAKDFISSLLVHRKEDRLSAVQCLNSVWLSQQNDEMSSKIPICTDKLKKFIIRRKWQVCTLDYTFRLSQKLIFAYRYKNNIF